MHRLLHAIKPVTSAVALSRPDGRMPNDVLQDEIGSVSCPFSFSNLRTNSFFVFRFQICERKTKN